VTISDVIVDLGQETAKQFADKFGEKRVFWKECDVTSSDQFEQLFAETKNYFNQPVNLLVNNAGVNHKLGWKKCMDIDIVSLNYKRYELKRKRMI